MNYCNIVMPSMQFYDYIQSYMATGLQNYRATRDYLYYKIYNTTALWHLQAYLASFSSTDYINLDLSVKPTYTTRVYKDPTNLCKLYIGPYYM